MKNLFHLILLIGMVAAMATADPVGADRIAALPSEVRPAWETYWAESQRLRAVDEMFIQNELAAMDEGAKWKPAPTRRNSPRPDRSWFETQEALAAAGNLLTFQTPAGGWGKNLDNIGNPRENGMGFTESRAHYRGTFDNNATINPMRMLGRTVLVQQYEPARRGFLKGLDYILAAQYPTGGWPQVYPLEGGYHDNITYNDGAMINIMEFLEDVAKGSYPFVDELQRKRAGEAIVRGLQCILDCQVVEHGVKKVWCAQHDPLTLEPAKARSFEWASLSGGESAGIAVYLMEMAPRNVAVDEAVEGAYQWFKEHAIYGKRFRMRQLELVDDPSAGPVWARFYELETGRPMFVQRDAKAPFYSLDELPPESNGYAWYQDAGKNVLDKYDAWKSGLRTTGPGEDPVERTED